MPVDALYDTRTHKTALPHESEYFANAMKACMALREEGLADFWTIRSKVEFEKYPTLLVNTHDFTNQNIKGAVPEYRNLDMANYHLCILYPDTQPILPLSKNDQYTAFAYAMENANTDEFIRFMNWLDTEENYRLFMNGHEGIDYQLENRQMIYQETALSYDSWDQRRYFMRPYLETYLPSNLPSNYEDIVNSPSPFSYTIPLDAEGVESLLRDASEDMKFVEAINKFNMDYLELTEKLLGATTLSNVDMILEDFVKEKNENPSTIYIKGVFEGLNE